jgi:hypothetical protein
MVGKKKKIAYLALTPTDLCGKIPEFQSVFIENEVRLMLRIGELRGGGLYFATVAHRMREPTRRMLKA